MEGFTKEVLMMWKVLVVEGERCTVPRAGKKGLKKKKNKKKFIKVMSTIWPIITVWLNVCLCFSSGAIEGLKSLVEKTQVGVKM